MIPEDHKASVITNGLHFLRSITEAYGSETGLKLWEDIANTLDPDVKGQIFLAMITGTYNNRVHIKDVAEDANAVSCIKEIRTWSGASLKEAKDMLDRVRYKSGDCTEHITVKPTDYHRAVSALRAVGFTV